MVVAFVSIALGADGSLHAHKKRARKDSGEPGVEDEEHQLEQRFATLESKLMLQQQTIESLSAQIQGLLSVSAKQLQVIEHLQRHDSQLISLTEELREFRHKFEWGLKYVWRSIQESNRYFGRTYTSVYHQFKEMLYGDTLLGGETFQIFVKVFESRILTLKVSSSTTIGTLKG